MNASKHSPTLLCLPLLQYGPGTASLNVAVAASIVLHSFALWAGYTERERQGQKFVVPERPERTRPRGACASLAVLPWGEGALFQSSG
jgi:hypothetical protein